MNRRNFITTGLISTLPIPSLGLASAKPNTIPKTFNQFMAALEQAVESRVKQAVNSWGFATPEFDHTKDWTGCYFGSSRGLVGPFVLRQCGIKRFDRGIAWARWDVKDVWLHGELVEHFAAPMIKHLEVHREPHPSSFSGPVYITTPAEYIMTATEHLYSVKDAPSCIRMDLWCNWVRKDDVKIQSMDHYRRLYTAWTNGQDIHKV